MSANRRGSTITFVLLIMLIAMLITATLTAVVVGNLRNATAYKEHAYAYYGMESALERALYYTQYARSQKTVGAQATLNTITAMTDTLSNDTSYGLSPVFKQDYTVDISENLSAQWDIYAEDYSSGYHLEPTANLDHVHIEWSPASSCSGTAEIEVSFSAWTEFAWQDFTDPGTLTTHYTYVCSTATCFQDLGLDSTYLYKIRVTALNCDIQDVIVRPQDSNLPTSTDLSTNNYIDLIATGSYGRIQQTGTMTVPWNPALNPYFEYVLFAEDTITK